jgi:hypothetical protein
MWKGELDKERRKEVRYEKRGNGGIEYGDCFKLSCFNIQLEGFIMWEMLYVRL